MNVLWYIVILSKTYLLALLIYRKAYREHGIFTLYIAFSCVRSYALLALSLGNFSTVYFWTYWAGSFIGAALVAAVIIEIGSDVFSTACYVFRTHVRKVTNITFGILAFVAIFAIQLPAERTLASWCLRLDRTTSVLALFVFWGMALGSRYLGIVWRQRTYGIALGFLFYYMVSPWVDTLFSMYSHSIPRLAFIRTGTVIITQACWIAYFSFQRKKQRITLDQIDQARKALRELRTAV